MKNDENPCCIMVRGILHAIFVIIIIIVVVTISRRVEAEVGGV